MQLMLSPRPSPCAEVQHVIIGGESVGKSLIASSLTGKKCGSANYRGTTVRCDIYSSEGRSYIDTPGIIRESDTETTRLALAELESHDTVLLVVSATHLDDDLKTFLPLLQGKRGCIAVTFWDKVQHQPGARKMLRQVAAETGLAIVPLDSRHINAEARFALLGALDNPQPFPASVQTVTGWRIEPHRGVFDRPLLGPMLAIVLLLIPAVSTVWIANFIAGVVDPYVSSLVEPVKLWLAQGPQPLGAILAGKYGLLTMGPLMFVWSIPTVSLYAIVLGLYKASGLVDRIDVAIHPLMRPFGLTGRDTTRIIMGFGCNVPAVISTRACSNCTRATCITAICFGSACSYQYGATMAVFNAAKMPYLWLPYVLYLLATTLLFTRLTAPSSARSRTNRLVFSDRTFLVWPSLSAIWREAGTTLRHFMVRAVPVFMTMAVIASLADWLGALDAASGTFGAVMSLFRLPSTAALPVLLASIRKDGILLFDQPDLTTTLSPLQLLTGVYLAGVMFPCLVTAWTVARERSFGFALWLMLRQAIAACLFAAVLAWVPYLLGGAAMF